MCDGECGIALHSMQGIWASSRGEGKYGFSHVVVETWGIFSRYCGDGHSKPVFVQRSHNSCLVMRDTSGISTRFARAIRMLFEVRLETEGPFLVPTVILGFLSIFKLSQASSHFGALNSACLSRCQSDLRNPVQMRRGHRAFSSVSTEDSDIPSSCEMKDEPEFKPL